MYFIALYRINLDTIKILNPDIKENYIHWALSFDAVISGLILLLGGYYLARNRKVKIFKLPATKPYFLFLIISFVSLFYSLDKIVGIRNFVQYLTYFIIYILVINVLDSRDKNYKMILMVLLSSLIPLLAGFYQAITTSGNLTATLGLNRICATLIHPNTYGYYLMIMLIFILTVFFHTESPKYKVFCAALIIPVFVSLILTYSRGAWLSILLGLVVFSLILFRNLNFKRLTVLIIILFVISMVLAHFRLHILERFFSLGKAKLDTFGFRLEMWDIYLEKFIRHPLRGYGLGSSIAIAEEEMNYFILPHNDYIGLMVEVGAIGLCFYLATLISLVVYFLRKSKGPKDNVLSAGIVALTSSILLAHSGDNLISFRAVFSYFWIFTAVAYNFLNFASEEK